MKTKAVSTDHLQLLIFFPFLLWITAALLTGCGHESRAEENRAAVSDSAAVPADSAAAPDSAKQAAADSAAAKEKEKSEANAVPVEVAAVTRGAVYDYIQQNTTVDTEDGVDIFSRLTGEVVKLAVEEGSRVRPGAVLCVLEDSDYRLALDKARNLHERNKSEYERSQSMYEKHILSEEKLNEARFNVEQARLDLERAELDYKRTRITAPIGGVITTRFVRLGERVTTANPLFKIIETDEKIAVVHVPERETARVRNGQKAFILTETLPDSRFEARIKRIAPAVDAASGTFKVTVGVSDPENILKAGMFVAVHIITDTHPNALLIPKASVVYENGLPYAFFMESDTLARKLRLEKGYSDQQHVEVLADLKPGARVVVTGQNGLKDGTRVKIVLGFLSPALEVTEKDTTVRESSL